MVGTHQIDASALIKEGKVAFLKGYVPYRRLRVSTKVAICTQLPTEALLAHPTPYEPVNLWSIIRILAYQCQHGTQFLDIRHLAFHSVKCSMAIRTYGNEVFYFCQNSPIQSR